MNTINSKSLIDRWVSPELRSLKAYNVADAKGMIKLDAMESPYPMPESLRQSWLEALADAQINRYPDPASTSLKAEIQRSLGFPDACSLMLGNGSDELIQIIAILLGGKGRCFLSPTPSFSMYQQISLATSTEYVGVPLNPDFTLNLDLMLEKIKAHKPACIFLAYPNNPTGNCFHRSEIEQILDQAPGMVVVDEAYNAFCNKSFIGEIEKHPNLVILRTLSKSGFAGLRLGILAAGAHWVDEMEKIRLPYNINILTQISTAFFLRHYDVIKEYSNVIVKARAHVADQLAKISGIIVYPSETNFILLRTEQGAGHVHQSLIDKRVLVKNLHGSSDALKDCLRITVSNESENKALLDAISDIHT